MKRFIYIFLGLLLAGSFLLAQNSELDGYFLRKISYNGNESLPSSQLKRVISLKPIYTHQGMKRITYRYIKSERKKIKNYYVSEGFLNCTVEDSLIIYKKNKIHLFFNIHEYDRFRIKQISIEGNTLMTDGEILDILDLRIGDAFKQQKYYSNIKKILSRYSELGRPFATISEEFDWSSHMEIRLVIDEKTNYEINRISIEGNEDVRKASVKKQLIIESGKLYRQTDINRSRDRIYEMGTFNSVNILPEKIDSSAYKINLKVDLVKSKIKRFDVLMGARQGYTEKVDYSALFVEPSWLHKNVLGRAHRININGSYEAIIQDLSSLNVSNGFNAEVGYTVPWLGPVRLPSTFKLYYQRSVYSPFSDDEVVLEDDIETEYGLDFSNIWRYNRKTYTKSSFSLINQKSELGGGGYEPQVVFTLRSRFDNRDNFIYPTKGFAATIYGGYRMGTESETETEYIRGEVSVSYYSPLLRNLTFAGRVEVGQIVDYKNISPLLLYRMGSETTVRGWFQSIGTAYEIEKDDTTTYTIYAGKSKTLGNIELRYDIIWNFGVNTFLDVGKLSDNFSDFTQWENYYVNTGFGIYYKTPIGAVRLEIPIRLNDPGDSDDYESIWQRLIFGLLFAF